MGPRQDWAGIFLFFKLTSNHHNISTLIVVRFKDVIDFIEMLNIIEFY